MIVPLDDLKGLRAVFISVAMPVTILVSFLNSEASGHDHITSQSMATIRQPTT